MPTLDVLDYERFSLDGQVNLPMSLHDATSKAIELRTLDRDHLYKVEAQDSTGTNFTVRAVPIAEVYADALSKILRVLTRNRSIAKR